MLKQLQNLPAAVNMKSNKELMVTIVIPVYNGENFITETLASVKMQTYTDFECLIIDDGSTDNTAAIVKEWIKDDKRFLYLYQQNKGLSGARNTGLDHAKGNLIQFLDADDVILPTKLEKQINAHFANTTKDDLILSYTDYTGGLSSNIYQPADYYTSAQFYTTDYASELISRWESTLSIPPNCFLFSANIFKDQHVRFDEAIPNHEDFDCWLRILNLNVQVKYLNEKLCIYRVTEGSMSKNMKKMSEGFLQTINKHIHFGYDTRIKKILLTKRRKIKESYRRFDLMDLKEKLLAWRTFVKYYKLRFAPKSALKK